MEDNTYQDIFNNNNNISSLLYKNSNTIPSSDDFITHSDDLDSKM